MQVIRALSSVLGETYPPFLQSLEDKQISGREEKGLGKMLRIMKYVHVWSSILFFFIEYKNDQNLEMEFFH
jgi:hypothetical protein